MEKIETVLIFRRQSSTFAKIAIDSLRSRLHRVPFQTAYRPRLLTKGRHMRRAQVVRVGQMRSLAIQLTGVADVRYRLPKAAVRNM